MQASYTLIGRIKRAQRKAPQAIRRAINAWHIYTKDPHIRHSLKEAWRIAKSCESSMLVKSLYQQKTGVNFL